MRKGDVPVPYIVAVVLGIIIIGVIGYWFFVSSGKFGGAMNEQECRAKEIQWCTLGYNEPNKDWDSFAPRCSKIGVGIPTCTGSTTGGTGAVSSTDCSCHKNAAGKEYVWKSGLEKCKDPDSMATANAC